MERFQHYIGTPSGVVLCVNQMEKNNLQGWFYHAYSRKAVPVTCFNDLWFKMEELFDTIHFPFPGTEERSFIGKRRKNPEKQETVGALERKKVMSEKEMLNKHGDLGTFIVRVQHRQNSTWQGKVTWVDENKTMQFRSVWELTKLIAAALDTTSMQEE